MAQAAEFNTSTQMPSASSFRLQMEGLATAGLYLVCFGWTHLGSTTEWMTPKVLAVFFAGLIVIPLLTGLPLALVRRLLVGILHKRSRIAAFLPFAQLALYALQGILVWVATHEAYVWIFTGSRLFT
jgi:hypothetical protein